MVDGQDSLKCHCGKGADDGGHDGGADDEDGHEGVDAQVAGVAVSGGGVVDLVVELVDAVLAELSEGLLDSVEVVGVFGLVLLELAGLGGLGDQGLVDLALGAGDGDQDELVAGELAAGEGRVVGHGGRVEVGWAVAGGVRYGRLAGA